MPLQLESNAGIANELLSIERYQLGLDYLRRYGDIIRAVTREQILETAATYLDPDRLTLATAGTLRGKA
jgi:zinc protease